MEGKVPEVVLAQKNVQVHKGKKVGFWDTGYNFRMTVFGDNFHE